MAIEVVQDFNDSLKKPESSGLVWRVNEELEKANDVNRICLSKQIAIVLGLLLDFLRSLCWVKENVDCVLQFL